jgi:hypothetical protein
MPILYHQQVYTVPSTGGTYTLPTQDITQEYLFYGGGIMTGNIVINPSGNDSLGLTYIIKWFGVADLTTNSKTLTVFGVSLSAQQALNTQTIIATYNGTSYDVEVHSNFADNFIVETNNVALLNINSSLLGASAVTTSKINNLAVTDAKINDVDGSKIVAASIVGSTKLTDATVTDAKFATGTAASVRYRNASGVIGNLALANNEVAIGNGTSVVAVNKSTFNSLPGTYEVFNIEVSFEANEVAATRYIYLPFSCTIQKIKTSVTKNIAATDVASVILTDDGAATVIATQVIPASTTVASASFVATPSYVYTAASTTATISLTTTKTTVGGKAFVSITVSRT